VLALAALTRETSLFGLVGSGFQTALAGYVETEPARFPHRRGPMCFGSPTWPGDCGWRRPRMATISTGRCAASWENSRVQCRRRARPHPLASLDLRTLQESRVARPADHRRPADTVLYVLTHRVWRTASGAWARFSCRFSSASALPRGKAISPSRVMPAHHARVQSAPRHAPGRAWFVWFLLGNCFVPFGIYSSIIIWCNRLSPPHRRNFRL